MPVRMQQRKHFLYYYGNFPELETIERFFFTGELDEQTRRYIELEKRKERVLKKYKSQWELD